MGRVPNPWKELAGSGRAVLACDRPYVDAFNHRLSRNHQHRIDVDLLPEPFLGNPGAPLVVLLANPGVDKKDSLFHAKPAFRAALLASIGGQRVGAHFFIGSGPANESPGQRFWRRALNALVQDGLEPEWLAKKILTVQYFPYHSSRFGHAELRLPSQSYTFQLVRDAIARKALIVCTRRVSAWLGAIPELVNHSIVCKNPQTVALSPGNLEIRQYRQVLDALRSV